nr:MAG TPA: hypothetical protein [Caudoviricetes sp.]
MRLIVSSMRVGISPVRFILSNMRLLRSVNYIRTFLI